MAEPDPKKPPPWDPGREGLLLRAARGVLKQSQKDAAIVVAGLGGAGGQQAFSGWEDGATPDSDQKVEAVRRYIDKANLDELLTSLVPPTERPQVAAAPRDAAALRLVSPNSVQTMEEESDDPDPKQQTPTANLSGPMKESLRIRIREGPPLSDADYQAVLLDTDAGDPPA